MNIKNTRLLIQCKGISKKYGEIIAINNLDLNIYKRQHIGIIGPNGGGKSTLVEMICGIRQPNKGNISYYFNDADPNKKTKSNEIGKDIGVQFQESKYPVGIVVLDLLKFYLNLYQVKNKKEVLDFYIKTFKLEGLEKKQIMRLSGGQQQRVNIALSIIHNPSVVVLDEISTGLDIKARQDIKSLVQKLADENHWTLIMISHNMEEIEFLCDRVIYLRYGKIIHDYSIEQIKAKWKNMQAFADENIKEDEEERVKLRIHGSKKNQRKLKKEARLAAKKEKKLKKNQEQTNLN